MNFDFVKRQRLATNSLRIIRSRGQQGKQNQRGFNNSSTSPFEGYVQPPEHIPSGVLKRASLFTVAVSVNCIVQQCSKASCEFIYSSQLEALLASQSGNTKRSEVKLSTSSKIPMLSVGCERSKQQLKQIFRSRSID